MEYTVISIGALSHNRLWHESGQLRTPHATTTLVRDQGRMILVDPSLPGPVLEARFNERTGKRLSDVTDVFCTTLRPAHRRGLRALPQAAWWAHEAELESFRSYLQCQPEDPAPGEDDGAGEGEDDLRMLEAFQPAPECFVEQVHLYPLPGSSAGSAGLLLTPPTRTILIAGDAVLTREHLESGQVWEGSADLEAAMRSLRDVLEIADIVVPGHDNIFVLPGAGLRMAAGL